MSNMGGILRNLRVENGYSQKDLAELLNVAQNTISNWEKGVREPDNETLSKLAELFDCTIDYLLGRTDMKEPAPPTYDDEASQLLEHLHKRPEMKTLFSVSKKASKEDIEKTIKIIEALKGDYGK